MPDFDAMIEAIVAEVRPIARADPAGWERIAVTEIIPRHLKNVSTPEAFFRWAQNHRVWQFTVAECVERVCAKPPELAVEVLRAIVEELLEGDQAPDSFT